MSLTVGVDVGGTKIAAGLVTGDGRIVERRRRATPAHDGDATALAVVELVEELRATTTRPVTGVGIGVPGFVNAARDDVLLAPNMAWPVKPIGDVVAAATGLPTVLENDGNAAAWGEHRYGAGQGSADMLLVCVGTGIGGGLVLGGRLHRGGGMAGEVGHLALVPGGEPCGCGLRGCWEAYASGTAMTRAARAAVTARAPGSERLSSLTGGDPARVTGGLVTEAALAGDPFSRDLLHRLGTRVGQGLASLVAVLDPTLVVIGGGVVEAGDLLLGPVAASLHRNTTGAGVRAMPRLAAAGLGNDAGLVGAAALAADARVAVPCG